MKKAKLKRKPKSGASLHFSFPDDKYDFNLAVRAYDIHRNLCEIHDTIRSYRKYGSKYLTKDQLLEEIWELINNELIHIDEF